MAKSTVLVSECVSVIARFPEDAALVVELMTAHETFRALCEEHALATETIERSKGAGGAYDPTFYEYLGIIRDLEHEIATAIANEKRSFRRAGGFAQQARCVDAMNP